MRWQQSGAKELEGAYKADLKNGTFSYYDEDGELTKTEEYKAGMRVGVKIIKQPSPKKPGAPAKK
jgi:antitoxin component YwqK of YwqJK toxin-antitoxin module